MIPLAKYIEGAAVVIGGAAVVFSIWHWKTRRDEAKKLFADAQSSLDTARRDAATIRHDAHISASAESSKLREQTETSFAARRQEFAESEKRLGEREAIVNSQLEVMLRSENNLRQERETVAKRAEELDVEKRELHRMSQLRKEQLAREARFTEAEARAQLMREVEQEALSDASKLSRQIIDDAKLRADEKARQIITTVIQRYAGSHTADITTATITLPGEEMKGRIIGRDGRNIRAFETATGVTVLIDDTPNAVVLSGFDPVRREIAREAMTQLIADGRIHPTRIEEVVAKVSQETEANITQLGELAVNQAGVALPAPEIVTLLGKLHFRLSYSQNVLSHSVEVAHLMGLMAAELGLDVETAKRCGLFHDLGKAVSHEVEGPHALSGAEILKRHGESESVVNGVASHHHDVPPVGPWGLLVSAADAISASRPGARAENMETYIKRVEDLEKIALAFPGVEKCYAMHAGRELRVFVKPEEINDEQAFALARKIATQIEEKLQYPGQVRVTVVREKRCVEVAK